MTIAPASVGIRALATSTPSVLKTNAYWRTHHPDLVADAERRNLSRLWSRPTASTEGSAAFDVEMEAFLTDPFRGTRERYVLGPGESSLTLGEQAARAALQAARLEPGDIDLMIVSAFMPAHTGPGDAAFLARKLGLRGAAWNLESACASALVALQTAQGLVVAGQYRCVLVVVTCTYSPTLEDGDSMAWFLGDGAGAFVVGAVEPGRGILGAHTVHTGETCGAASFRAVDIVDERPVFRFQAGADAGRILRDSSGGTLRLCCDGALRAAGVTMDEIDFFVFNTATAWFAPFCTRALDVDPDSTINPFPRFANIGPALTPVNLWCAAHEGLIAPDDLVLVYAVGSVSSAGAAVMRWGDVAVAPPPAAPLFIDPTPAPGKTAGPAT
jgi:3-oxoacyl-[acyl-carrier-protein] synthase-3